MSDESFYAPGHKLPKRQPQPGELLYEFYVERTKTRYRCELRTFPHGVEAQILSNDHGIITQLFRGPEARMFAIEWAEAERKAIQAGGPFEQVSS
jgi:hypothetical protein